VVEPCYNNLLNRCMYAGISHWFFRFWHHDLQCLGDLFRNLTRLHLVLSGDGPHGQARRTVSEGHIAHVLAGALQLKHLHLEGNGMPTVGLLPSRVTYQFLETASFRGFIEPNTLLHFLGRHRTTLSELRLDHCTLLYPGWTWKQRLLPGIKNTHLGLKSFSLQNVIDPNGHWSVPDQSILLAYLRNESVTDSGLREPVYYNNYTWWSRF
jgi:hypothetical protein